MLVFEYYVKCPVQRQYSFGSRPAEAVAKSWTRGSWFASARPEEPSLQQIYKRAFLPLEMHCHHAHFLGPPLSDASIVGKPTVLLIGPYSVGKTSFIRYLLGRDFQGMRIGPEPTTDRFVSIMHGRSDKIVPGAALCSQADRPFRGLSPFGNNFLSRFEGVEMDSPILRNITLVDTDKFRIHCIQTLTQMKFFAVPLFC